MRLASYRSSEGRARGAVVVDRNGIDSLIDLEQASAGRLSSDLLEVLRAGEAALDEAHRIAASDVEGEPVSSVKLLAPLPRPGKLICVAANFQAHIEEGGGKRVDKTTSVPKLFSKPSTSVIGPGDPLALPSISTEMDWELELAIVIGKGGRDISVERAREHILGYSVINDLSARSTDWGIPGRRPDDGDLWFDWLNGKWGDGFAPWGPWITTSDAVSGDPNRLEMTLRVNDKVWQQGSTGEMIFSPEEIIAFGSRFMTWEPGDVIAGGTLAGTGAAAGVYLQAGDVMAGTIGNLGTLVTPVEAG